MVKFILEFYWFSQEKEIQSLKSKLGSLDEFERIRAELLILKQSEFSIDASAAEKYSLEKLLTEKNQRLLTENNELKTESDQQKEMYDNLRIEMEATTHAAQSQRELIVKLEEDLANVNDQLSTLKKVLYLHNAISS